MTVLTPPSSYSTLLPSLSVKPSPVHQKIESNLDRLHNTPLPDKDINDLLNIHDSLTFQELVDGFHLVTTKMMQWLEAAQMAVYTLEQHAKEDSQDVQDIHPLINHAVGRMEVLVPALVELGDIVQDKYHDGDDQENMTKMKAKMTTAKIQSEWSGLQHYLMSVKRLVDNAHEKKALLVLMEQVLWQMDDLSTMIFLFQERRHGTSRSDSAVSSDTGYPDPTQSPLSSSSGSLFSSSTTITAATTVTNFTTTTNNNNNSLTAATQWSNTIQRNDQILADIDAKVGPLFNDVQRVYTSMTSPNPPQDPSGILDRKHALVQERWESLRLEIDDLKEELKENRWLTVFRQVADQVDIMMGGLEKAVHQCYTIIQQVRDWHASHAIAAPPTPPTPGNAPERALKSIMRTVPRSSLSVSSNSSNGSCASPPPVDIEKLRAAERSFDAKYKHYAPSINKMLTMLGSGIVTRVTQDTRTIHRHEAMVRRWTQLKATMDRLWHEDLPEADRILVRNERFSSATKSMYTKPPEHRGSTASPNKAPLKPTILSKMPSVTNRYSADDLQRHVRSVTPNGTRPQRQPLTHQASPLKRAASSMAHLRDSDTAGPSGSDSSSIESAQRSVGRIRKSQSRTMLSGSENQDKSPASLGARRKSRVFDSTATTDKAEASWMKPTKSTIMRSQQTLGADNQSAKQKDTRPKTPITRSKTPTPSVTPRKTMTPRPKSSAGHHTSQLLPPPPTDRQRSVSPIRRTMTPCLIPRPKTPSDRGNQWRAGTPSQIPRPQSAMQRRVEPADTHMNPLSSANNALPTQAPSLKRSIQKKQSMPALSQRASSPFRETRTSTKRSSSPISGLAGHASTAERASSTRARAGTYQPQSRDPLDVHVAQIINANPMPVYCQRAPQGGGKYYFGNPLNPALGGGRRLYTCKLMSYTDRRSTDPAKATHYKVLIRVGGGWEELQVFLFEHASLFV